MRKLSKLNLIRRESLIRYYHTVTCGVGNTLMCQREYFHEFKDFVFATTKKHLCFTIAPHYFSFKKLLVGIGVQLLKLFLSVICKCSTCDGDRLHSHHVLG